MNDNQPDTEQITQSEGTVKTSCCGAIVPRKEAEFISWIRGYDADYLCKNGYGCKKQIKKRKS